ncbi:MAG: hypothetical protein ASARMPRED_000341 [Alectoria sarmentosa]|nr:MAG: hypothetical protein ASARMPRED_000341 [Alectoria sarmentosa]
MHASQVLFGLGFATASYTALRFLRFIYLYTRPSSIKRYLYGHSPWALVTGASDGIGLGIAQELAANGFNVILHGRNPQKLERTKSQLEGEFKPVQFKIAVLDASSATSQQIDELVASFDDLNLTVLVNNVGGGAKVQPLEKNTGEELDFTINVNARFPAQLTKALLPKLSRPDGPTLIMNIGSLADSGVPYATVYGGSKAFNMAMSSSLAVEVKVEGKNIEVLAIPVGRVTDVAHSKEPSSFFTPTARTMARACVDRVGCGRQVVTGYVGHAMQKFVIDLLPPIVFEMLVVPTMKDRKDEEEKKKL